VSHQKDRYKALYVSQTDNLLNTKFVQNLMHISVPK
jgi:hypothetical protein